MEEAACSRVERHGWWSGVFPFCQPYESLSLLSKASMSVREAMGTLSRPRCFEQDDLSLLGRFEERLKPFGFFVCGSNEGRADGRTLARSLKGWRK